MRMRAVAAHRYGPPDVLALQDMPVPVAGPDEVLVRVLASAITQGDRRMRAADFGGVFTVPGRLFFGIRGPRFRVPGTTFVGCVEAVGERVEGFEVGQRVFGLTMHGAHAEFVKVRASGAIAPLPEAVRAVDAASLSYGAATALWFLRNIAEVQPEEHVVVVGAGGGVGRAALQVAVALGARVTAVCRERHHALARDLGASCVVSPDVAENGWAAGPVDVVFDLSGQARYRAWRKRMPASGRMVVADTTLPRLLLAACTALGLRPRLHIGFAPDRRDLLEDVDELVWEGKLRPVVARTFPLEEIVGAHRCLEEEPLSGDVVVVVGGG